MSKLFIHIGFFFLLGLAGLSTHTYSLIHLLGFFAVLSIGAVFGYLAGDEAGRAAGRNEAENEVEEEKRRELRLKKEVKQQKYK